MPWSVAMSQLVRTVQLALGLFLRLNLALLSLGKTFVIMETAVLRGARNNTLRLGNNALVGPRAYLSGCEVGDKVFLATGATVFNGARIGAGSEVRINGVVHLRTVLEPNSTVPIGWIAVSHSCEVLPPDEHDPNLVDPEAAGLSTIVIRRSAAARGRIDNAECNASVRAVSRPSSRRQSHRVLSAEDCVLAHTAATIRLKPLHVFTCYTAFRE